MKTLTKSKNGKIKYVSFNQIKDIFCCPYDLNKSLIVKGASVVCPECKRKYPIRNKITEFIDPLSLDSRTRRELKGNTYKLDKKTIQKYAAKDEWSSYLTYCSDRKVDLAIKKLGRVHLKKLISLGSGTGFE